MLLRDSEFKGDASFDHVISMAKKAKSKDEEGYRSEFVRLVEGAESLSGTKKPAKNDTDDKVRILPVNGN